VRAITIEAPGGPEVLEYREDCPQPEPKANQVRIKVAYAGLNYFDVLIRSGRYQRHPRYPAIPGGEVSGVVDAVGPGVNHLRRGQPVAALTGSGGGYADYALAETGAVIPLPHDMSLRLAAAFPLQVLTAWGVLNSSGRAMAGEWVLVHAAAGGVGAILCQLARDKGCLVIGTAGTDDKCRHAKDHGAQWVVNYRETEFHKQVMEITAGHGADLICDSVGKAVQSGNMRSLAHFGRIVVFGYASGEPKYNMSVLWGRSAGVTTYGLYHQVLESQTMRRAVRETLPAVYNGELRLPIGGVLPISECAEAHRRLEGRETMGKLLLAVNDELDTPV
jgi:NADPH:quinone reductase